MRFLSVVLGVFYLIGAAYAAGPNGTPDEAIALLDRAIRFYDQNGMDAAFAQFSDPKGAFVDRDLYVIVSSEEGVFLAHGANRGLINKNLWDLKDVNGIYIIRAMIPAGKSDPAGTWTSYTWTNPTTKKLEPKKTFVKVHDKLFFMVGIYARDAVK